MKLNQIYNEDCMKAFPNIENESIDLVILDPNYQDWDKFCGMGLIEESMRVLKPDGNIICFTKQPFSFNLRTKVNDILRWEFVWTFSNGGKWVSNSLPLVTHNNIYWLSKTKKCFFNARTGIEYGEKTKNAKRRSKIFFGWEAEGRTWEKDKDGKWIDDVLHYNKRMKVRPYISTKPFKLISVLINSLCKKGGVVLDPFMGSGTTALVCLNTEYNFIGFENNKSHFDAIMERIAQVEINKEDEADEM